MVTMKGNNGRAAMRRQIRVKQAAVAGIALVTCCISLYIISFFDGSRSPDTGFEDDDHLWEKRRKNRDPSELRKNLANKVNKARSHRGTQYIDVDPDQDSVALGLMLEAKVNLVDIRHNKDYPDSPHHLNAEFCRLEFSAHKQDPSSVPMFRHLVAASPECEKRRYRIRLKSIASLARQHDLAAAAELGDAAFPKLLNLTGVAFHESRCGSTLVANSLIAMDPDHHRVYSESAPPIVALRGVCGDSFNVCSKETAANLLKDVMYLMSRSDDSEEERVFFKIQSIGTRHLEVFQSAFPDVPFVFIYRDPVQVLMSQMKYGPKSANCVQAKRLPQSQLMMSIFEKHEKNPRTVSADQYCAAHLASITESAVKAIRQSKGMGMSVNYPDLPRRLYEEIFPKHFGMEIRQENIDRIEKVCSLYSKGAGQNAGEEFHEDSEEKEKHATQSIKDAAALFLEESYKELESMREIPVRIESDV